jgi:hypothetical protein
MDTEAAITQATLALTNAALKLFEAGATLQQLANTIPAAKLLGFIPRPESFIKTGEGFLIGALFVTLDGRVFEPGQIVRASRQVMPDHQAQSAQRRRAVKDKLLGAKFAEGSTVLIDARPIPLDNPKKLTLETGALVLHEDLELGARVLVRWMPGADDSSLRPLEEYLSERLELALRGIAEA